MLMNTLLNFCVNFLRWCFFNNKFEFSNDLFVNKKQLAPAMQGYYMLELTAPAGMPTCMIRLLSGNLEICLPVKGKGFFKRICYFDFSVKSFECSLDIDEKYTQGIKLSFTKITNSFANKKIEKKLLIKLGRKAESEFLSKNAQYQLYDQVFTDNRAGLNYQSWIDNSESLLWSSNIDKNKDGAVKFSIVVPTYNAKPQWLDACFQSVLDQTYQNWQLVIVDDASTNTGSLACLKNWQAKANERLTVIYRENNGHICAATNTGLLQANGDFIFFLDHDDTLAPQALNELALSISDNPHAKVFYSDEDLMSEAGERITPHFKPDWNPELLLAHNYITHLCCYKADVIKQLSGMRKGLDGAQDYDLILRASTIVKTDQIIHIPKVLYHWRMVEGSTAMSAGAKSYATQAGLKALTDHMAFINSDATVEHSDRENFYKVNWPLELVNSKQPKVSIIIPTRDGLEVLKPCIDGLLSNTDYKNLEIIIVDNGSEKAETLTYLKQLSSRDNIKVIRDDGPFNYSYINNLGVSHASGELICLLNNDIEIIHKDWLTEMATLAMRKNVGCVGAKLLYPDNTIQHAGVIMGLGGYAAHSHRGIGRNDAGYFCRAQVRQNLSAVTAACLLVKHEIYDLVGGLDEAFKVAYNDVDFCLRVQAKGYKNIYTPYAELYHHESKTRGSDNTPQNQKRFDNEKSLLLKRWSKIINHDPAYNPNLTHAREDFSIGSTRAN